jgi:cytochrome c553
MDFRGDDSTIAATDLVEWQGTWDMSVYTYKDAGFRSSHFYPNRASMAESWTGTPTGALRTNLTCSTCHDPHGVKTTATYPPYRVPILRGTWLTSPYLEDAVPFGYQTNIAFYDWRDTSDNTPGTAETLGARFHPERAGNRPNTVGWGYANESGNTGVPGYFIDDNTFGLTGGYSSTATGQDVGIWSSGTSSRQPIFVKHMDSVATSPGGTQTSTVTATDGVTNMTIGSGLSSNRIAGLCEACHLFDDTTSAGDLGNYTGHKTVVGLDARSAWNTSWTKMFTRPYMHMKHRYLQHDSGGNVECDWGDPDQRANGWHDGSCGYRWGVDPNPSRSVQSNYHKFSCSKCHTPHASRLPRLMATNCLDVGPDAGGYGGKMGDTFLQASLKHAQGTSYFYPWTDDSGTDATTGEQVYTTWFNQGTVPWGQDIAVSCHANDDGAGIWGVGSSTFWNSVTPW